MRQSHSQKSLEAFYSLLGVSVIDWEKGHWIPYPWTFYSLLGVSYDHFFSPLSSFAFTAFYSLLGVSTVLTLLKPSIFDVPFYSLLGVSANMIIVVGVITSSLSTPFWEFQLRPRFLIIVVVLFVPFLLPFGSFVRFCSPKEH